MAANAAIPRTAIRSKNRTQPRTVHVREQSVIRVQSTPAVASANSPCPRHRQRLQLSANRQRQRTRIRPQTVRSRELSTSANWSRTQVCPRTSDRQRTVRVAASRVRLAADQFPGSHPNHSAPMTSFDPATVRQAVAEFTPRRPQKFQDLIPAKDVIVELRQKARFVSRHCRIAHATLPADEQDGHRHVLSSGAR